ncbi:putative lipid-transfer protein DIR1 [Oryza brachyantha]|uniref:Bifunctional inhibitor/plant lipid transfer protein/seed storage helical domain-containing protein n=1 Tax=Oryza brachyantha TaxID=4533 RepID=J3MK32_ORYBR|nr:putative lipid-transfer protein DIR1 [Oryza brachyantha]
MAGKAQALQLLVLLAISLDSAARGAHAICNMSNGDFRLCQPAAAVADPTDSPSAECCAALGNADLACICRYRGVAGFWMRIYHIDAARAMALPAKCGLAMPANCS